MEDRAKRCCDLPISIANIGANGWLLRVKSVFSTVQLTSFLLILSYLKLKQRALCHCQNIREFKLNKCLSVWFPVGVHKRKRFCSPICLRASQRLHSCCFGSRNYAPCCTLTLPSSRLASETLVLICMERGLEHPIFTHGAYKHTTRTPRCSNTNVCTFTIQGLTFCLRGHPRYHPGSADGDLWRWWLSQRSHGDSLWGARQKSSHQYVKKA